MLLGQGHTISQVCKQIGITDQTCYRWRKMYGGMKVDQAKRLKDREHPAEASRSGSGAVKARDCCPAQLSVIKFIASVYECIQRVEGVMR